MNTHSSFSTVPLGLYLFHAHYESLGRKAYLLKLKTVDDEWYKQPDKVPCYMSGFKGDLYDSFWTWAVENLPIYEHQEIIRASTT